MTRAAVALSLAIVSACGSGRSDAQARAGAASEAQGEGLRYERVASGLRSPVHMAAPAGDARLFIVEQDGRIIVLKDGAILPRAFLDISARVGSGGERGLLSLAFHPRYAENGRFFVDYTDRQGETNVSEFRAVPGADTAIAGSERRLLRIHQPFANHNGGHVLFGPDGRLYVGMGDGGAAGDPAGNAQDPRALLGKVLRLDVDAAAPAPEIWALGVRNPWRMTFDAGLLYIADVGQNAWEEINVAPADSPGVNYGWRPMEGGHCYLVPVCGREGRMMPVVEYSHDEGCSVTGGVVYRGAGIPALRGHYLYTDWCSGWLRSFRIEGRRATTLTRWRVDQLPGPTSFGTDGAGEVYVATGDGAVLKIVPATGATVR